MKRKAQKVFGRLEAQRNEIINSYNSMTPEQLRFNPGPGKWNLLQVLRHLITAEKQSLILIQRKMGRKDEVPKAGFGSAFRHFLLKTALILPFKYKAPKIAEVNEEFPDFEAMKTEWDSIRGEIKSLIENNDDNTLAKALYRHPRAGTLNIKQAIEFMATHISHHQKQIERIKKHSAFPVGR